MLAYIIRRLIYAIPILIGVNLLTFALFFVVNTPEQMARVQLGDKHVTEEAVQEWKAQRGYDKPLLINGEAEGAGRPRRCGHAVPWYPVDGYSPVLLAQSTHRPRR